MKAFLSSIIILMFVCNCVSGQTISFSGPGITQPGGRPLVIVDSFKTAMNYFVCDPGKIESITIYKDSTAIAKYGGAGKFGVVVIQSKGNADFLRADKIIDSYNLSPENRGLRVCINKTLLPERNLILIDRSKITGVEITTDRLLDITEDASTGERFINIQTQKYN